MLFWFSYKRINFVRFTKLSYSDQLLITFKLRTAHAVEAFPFHENSTCNARQKTLREKVESALCEMCLLSSLYEMLHRFSLQFTKAFYSSNVQTQELPSICAVFATLLKLKPQWKRGLFEMVESPRTVVVSRIKYSKRLNESKSSLSLFATSHCKFSFSIFITRWQTGLKGRRKKCAVVAL